MKLMRIVFYILIIFTTSCSSSLYVGNKYFDCKNTHSKLDTDLKFLVHASLKIACVENKDIPDFGLIKNHKKFYVLNTYSINSEVENRVPFKYGEIPTKIGDTQFCGKSKSALQQIANELKEDFLVLTLGRINLEAEKASIDISTSWIVSEINSKKTYLSGGGYTCNFIKNNSGWQFVNVSNKWISMLN